MMKEALLIFVKNIISGQVKTRLAKTIGENEAINIYKQLLLKTHAVVKNIDVDKIIFYSDNREDDLWNEDLFKKEIQSGIDLGVRMGNAFKIAFEKGYEKTVIIGTDCPCLDKNILETSFAKLNAFEIVIGPAADGGYYLIGMKENHPALFHEIKWSTNEVLQRTIDICRKYRLSYFLLPTLSDIDEEKDLIHLKAL